MPPGSSVRLWRLTGAAAVSCLVFAILLQGKPEFTNASRPPRGVPSPGVALQVARDLNDVDAILSDAPSPDREVMRFKQYIDFGFILSYTGTFVLLATVLSVPGNWSRTVSSAAMVCALATGLFDVLENLAILHILDLRLSATTPAHIHAISSASAAKWPFSALTLLLLAISLARRNARLARGVAALFALTAALIADGFHDPRFLVYEGYPALAALVGLAALCFRRELA